jgi:hypothetical protein
MTINQSILDALPQDQIKFSGQLLETIFVHNKTNIPVSNPTEITTIVTMIKSVPSYKTKSFILDSVDLSSRVSITKAMDNADFLAVFHYSTNLHFLETIFDTLTKDEQIAVLKPLFTSNKLKYTSLKRHVTGIFSMVGHDWITDEKQLFNFFNQEKRLFVDFINDAKKGLKDAQTYAIILQKKFESDDLVLLGKLLIHEFMSLNIPFSTQASFKCHLKFYYCLEPMVTTTAKLNPALLPAIQIIITGLLALPSIDWVVKVLNQLPVPIIELTAKHLLKYETIKDGIQRNKTLALLNDIKDRLDHKDAIKIKFAFSQL